ncbi:hypothetical protein NSQ54_17190 [Alkalihalobacillus sp. FSL W8-0930]
MNPIRKIFAGLTFTLVLVACGGPNEEKILGGWKVVPEEYEEIELFLEISDERMIHREVSDDDPVSIDYRLTNTQNDRFIIDYTDPSSGQSEFLFEGYFENKDKIIIENGNGIPDSYELIRVDNIAKEIAEEKARQEKEEAAASKEREKKYQEEQKRAAKEEEKLQEEKELAEKEEEKRQEASADEKVGEDSSSNQGTSETGLQASYLRYADELEAGIMAEAKELYEQDTEPGFYGQYYEEWDSLLQGVWDELQGIMPEVEFENLRSEQIDWINMKESTFADMPADVAVERSQGMDYLATETKDRTYYLIHHYLD